VLGGASIVEFNNPVHKASDLVFTPLLFAVAFAAGYLLRERTQEAELKVTLAAAEERARIARELHDIVAHSMSVMVLQVGAVRHRLPEGDDKHALTDVERTGRGALHEMRRLLGALRREDAEFAPQPGLDALPALVEGVGRAGLPVDLKVEGAPVPLPAGLDLSAYRIVQEGLTNALKHARASHAEVHLSYEPDVLRIEVRDDGHGEGNGAGHGLVGVRERVKIYGGEMHAGRVDGGGFELSTRFPIDGAVA
jgi:signal transduction histidine kinase